MLQGGLLFGWRWVGEGGVKRGDVCYGMLRAANCVDLVHTGVDESSESE